ncbi:hypothetical protein L6164_022467 [Bauhinia variegata]|uniref:Uncharacterized protein n=1 Tax=Bauhinia variegata TaxID=167791 RepID=A0ACB9MFR4_BAUVA|nr:hypothetical protein L6164_022467 [Bauhinia variegata]
MLFIIQVLVADSDKFKNPLAELWAKLVHLVQQKGDYSHIIAASNSFGKMFLQLLTLLEPIYAGNALCTIRYTGANPCVLTIRSTSFPIPKNLVYSKSNEAPLSQVDLSTFDEDCGRSRYMSHTSQDAEPPDLWNARIVITGDRGLKSAENFKMIEKLANKLGAAGICSICYDDTDSFRNGFAIFVISGFAVCSVGAPRADVDAEFVPNDLQKANALKAKTITNSKL